MKRRGFIQLLGLSAVAPEVLAEEPKFNHAWEGQWTNSGVDPRISPNEWKRQHEQAFSVTGPSSPTNNALVRFDGASGNILRDGKIISCDGFKREVYSE